MWSHSVTTIGDTTIHSCNIIMGVTYVGRVDITFVLVSIMCDNKTTSCLQQKQTLLYKFVVSTGICEQDHEFYHV